MLAKQLQLFCVSSLEKIFPDTAFSPSVRLNEDTMLLGERYSFQIAYCLEKPAPLTEVSVSLSGSLAEHISLRRTDLVPSMLPNFPEGDDFVLRDTPGLYPDPLQPFDNRLKLIPGQWHSLWITIPADCSLTAGTYDLTVTFSDNASQESKSCCFTVNRLDFTLPPQTLLCTQWFHTDCIADWYQIPVFSERYWELTERYMACAVSYGINMLLTPLFTPPLDTAVGGERTCVQLIDVTISEDGSYLFGFEKLEHWLALCDKCGVRYLEFSHLFTQWGAAHAPKIMATKASCPSERFRIFGWDTDSTGDEYRAFLDSFLPELMHFISRHQLEERCYFHISDEPHKEHLPQYLAAKQMVQKHIGSLPIMDALSDYEYYEQGVVELPVCCTDHIEPFLANQVPNLWIYYCCGQTRQVSNRFFCMPSLRNRILGIQLYRFQIQGFLQWGFNFWNSALSLRHINPYCVTDADCAFPSGDAFLVYPGEDGPVGSIRGEVFMDGLQDMRLLQLLESRCGRDAVLALLDAFTTEPLTFTCYPREDSRLLDFRRKCHEMLCECGITAEN